MGSMNITRRGALKLTAASVGASTLTALGFSPAQAQGTVRAFKLERTTETRNTCPYCSVGCGVIMYSMGDRAKNVTGTLRWLSSGERYEAAPLDRHQLIYLMDGQASLTLQGKTHDVSKGMGVYLAPSESVSVQSKPGATTKLFHLVVRQVPR